MRHDLARRGGGIAWVRSSRNESSDSEPNAGPIPARSRGARCTRAARHHCCSSAKRNEAIVQGALELEQDLGAAMLVEQCHQRKSSHWMQS